VPPSCNIVRSQSSITVFVNCCFQQLLGRCSHTVSMMADRTRPMNVFDDVSIEAQGENLIEKWEEFGSMDDVEDDLVLFVIEAHGAIEGLTSRTICNQIMDDEYSTEAFEYVYSDMSEFHREKLLNQCGILDDTLPNDLDDFRGLRNDIAHNRGRGLDWRDDDIETTIRDVIEVVKELHGVVYTAES